MAIGAGCGIVYEYLLAYYAGRVLGTLDTAVYGMIGIMVASMGMGAFFARAIKNPYSGFAWLELIISIFGGLSVLIMAAVVSYAFILPTELQQSFGLDPSIIAEGGAVHALREISKVVPFVVGAILGFFIGMEIPLIARIREDLYTNIKNNAGTIFGFDYIGGGIGAAIWVTVCLTQPIIIVAATTALLNIFLGAMFTTAFWSRIGKVPILITLKIIFALFLIAMLFNGSSWVNSMNSMLYKDKVVYSNNTRFQNLVITSRVVGASSKPILNLYINGRLQFSSADEKIYHAMLVSPAMEIAARKERVLVIGGGDGLAARDILKYKPESITLVDLDPSMTTLFTGQDATSPDWLNQRLLELNEDALSDERLNVVNRDAFLYVEELVANRTYFDVIIVDLPDPNHPDLNKLYSDYFYRQLSELLSGDGALVIQSTSPYHSKEAFQSIGVTANEAGFQVEQYHTNIPSFGEWGWTIATERGKTPLERLKIDIKKPVISDTVNRDFIIGSFNFPISFYKGIENIESNKLNNPVLYKYHSDGWRKKQGVFINNP